MRRRRWGRVTTAALSGILQDVSGPNTNYDPVEVEALKPEVVQANLDAALAAVAGAATMDDLKAAKIAHGGDKSPLALANREIGALPPAAKAEAGKRVGMARAAVKKALAAQQEVLEAAAADEVLVSERVDVTARPDARRIGSRHPVSLLADYIADVFVAMGWRIAEGPEVEAEWYNFDALNFGPDHPARQMQDTFYVDPPGSGLVMRTHTSPVQVRSLLTWGAPLYVACPGRVARTDELDATHLPVFQQVEGLAVDRGLSMAHLKGSLDHLAQQVFGEGVVTRLRPSFFPFTEPSAEMDLRCFVCVATTGTVDATCRACSGTGWIEWGGCGMVNPNVLVSAGLDPAEFTGFAFGMGIERGLMFRYGIADLRQLADGDIRVNTQFSVEI